ncbi:Hypothetical_protein [Hexamita inflata]|uniref:Hypothetical_protein n=1 Tax=Hexamita inflata TaxID=28002 RepID=A0AA86RFR9_9EUKA|nr:Hypothetical protein HINF_LOCUS64821 [Hexamita inflata]
MILIYQSLLQQSFVEDLANTYINTMNLQSGLYQLIQNLSRDSQPQSTQTQIRIHQVITQYINKRIQLLENLNPQQFANNSIPISSELPLLNSTTDATAERFDAHINLSIAMKTHFNSYIQNNNINTTNLLNNSFIEELKQITGPLDIMNTNQLYNAYEEIIYVDENLSTFIYPYNTLQYDYDASLTMASFSFNQIDNLDLYIDLNVNEKELEIQKLLLISIINIVAQTVYLNIYSIGSQIVQIFSGKGYNVDFSFIYAQLQISNKTVSFQQLISLFDQLYNNENRILIFILTKGIQCELNYKFFKEIQYSNTEFVLVNPNIISVQQIQQPMMKYTITDYIKQVNQKQTFKNDQEQFIIMNLKHLRAKLIDTKHLRISKHIVNQRLFCVINLLNIIELYRQRIYDFQFNFKFIKLIQ